MAQGWNKDTSCGEGDKISEPMVFEMTPDQLLIYFADCNSIMKQTVYGNKSADIPRP